MTSARTVAILFTDLVGSTELWARNGDAMAEALAIHDRLNAEAFGHADTVRHTGDGAMAVFDSIADAFAAATRLMGSMQAIEWPTDEPLRLRMGIHLGPAQERDGNWFGTAVNRAARIADAANARQLLVSEAAESAARDTVPGYSSVDLGRTHLKGLDRDETLFHVLGEAFTDPVQPRTRLMPSRPGPAPTAGLVGRDELIARLADQLGESQLVCLTGVGGVGKTQLALAVAARTGQDAVFVDLAPVGPDEVVAAFGEALGVSVDQRGRLAAVVAASRGRGLLIVDNCEHVLDAVADVLTNLMGVDHDIRLLATSREAIGVPGERVVRVPSLPPAAAEVLFVERAIAAGATVDPTDAAIAEICARLDGIPLAIELAAGRAPLLAPSQILERLDERFRLLGGGRRGTDRQKTLENVMDWSYGLLDPAEQAALHVAATFVGGFDLAAFAAVADLDEFAALDLLASLTDKSLLLPQPSPGGTRNTMLETVRLYGVAKAVEAGEAERLAMAHAAYFRGLAGPPESWVPSLQAWEAYALDPTTQPDEGNVRAALRWFDSVGDLGSIGLLAAGALFAVEIHVRDPERRFYERRDVVGALDGRLAEWYLLASAFSANFRGDWSEQMAFASDVLRISGDPEMRAVATALVVLVGMFFDDYEPEPMIASAIADLGGSRPDLERGLRSRATDLALGTGHAEAALESIRGQALAGDFVGNADYPKALVMLGRYDEALAWFDEAPAGWGSIGPLWAELVRVHAAAATDTDSAIRHLLAAEEVLRRNYDALIEAELLVAAAAIALGEDDPTHASYLLATTRASFRTPGGFGVYSVVRDRVRDIVPPDEVERIRSRASSVEPHEAFVAEVERLRARVDRP